MRVRRVGASDSGTLWEKHGPIALIDQHIPVIVLASNDSLQKKILSNAAEVAARGLYSWGRVYAMWLPEGPDVLLPFVQALAMQMVSYFVALAGG